VIRASTLGCYWANNEQQLRAGCRRQGTVTGCGQSGIPTSIVNCSAAAAAAAASAALTALTALRVLQQCGFSDDFIILTVFCMPQQHIFAHNFSEYS